MLAIRVDGNGHIGLGHVFRCLHLARALRTAGLESRFLTLESSRATIGEFLARDGFGVDIVSAPTAPWQADPAALDRVVAAHPFRAALVDLLIPDADDADLLTNPDYRPMDVPATLAGLRKMKMPVLAISDQFDRMTIEADCVFNTCPVQDEAWYRGTSLQGRCRLGPDYYLLPESFRAQTQAPRPFGAHPAKVVVFFGGNDHRGFTGPTIKALAGLRDRIRLCVIVGAATPDGQAIAKGLSAQGIEAHYRAPDLAPLLADAQLLLTASGNTLFDAAALGLPAIALSTRTRQRVTARYFDRQGSARDLGDLDATAYERLADWTRELLDNPRRLDEMSAAGRRLVDGRGLERTVKDILAYAR